MNTHIHRSLITLLLVGLVLSAAPLYAQPLIATPAFQRVWNAQDGPVADEVETRRSWTWGPAPISDLLLEPMAESPGGQRQVQYFDKSRMEINNPQADPNDPWYVTNGLLPIEMMTGRIQVGFDAFSETEPAQVSAIGDPGTFPTYAALAPLYESPGEVDPVALNRPVTRLLLANGEFETFTAYQNDPATVLLAGPNGHGVPRGFLDFQNSRGIVYQNGQAVQGQVYSPAFVFGLPVTAAYWVNSQVAGQAMPIMFQVFERRVLTYNPNNPPGARVEMGNVGQHFYRWRYGDAPPANLAPGRPVQPEQISFFGMNTYITGLERIKNDGDGGIAQLVNLGRAAGVEWAREELSWASLERVRKGQMSYDYFDRRLLQLAEANYGIVGILLTTPPWAQVGDCDSREGRIADYWCPPANPQDFADFAGRMTERYDGDGNNDAPGSPRIAVWQIWNEPSTRGTWPGTPAEYGAILAAGYQAIKAADPSATVITGGVYLYDGMGTDPNDGLPFLNQAFAAVPAAANSFDALAIHPYMPTAAPDAPVIFATITLWGRITTAQNWLQQYGGRPLWISEVGWTTCEPWQAGCHEDVAVNEEQQANYMVRAHAIALAQNVQHVNYFQLEDKFDGASRVFWGEASVLGTVNEGYRQKAAYRAYRTMEQQLQGMRFSNFGAHNTFSYNPTIENPQDLYHLRFSRGDRTLVDVLWHNAGTQQVRFRTEPGYTAELISRDGTVTPISGGSVTINVSGEPVYVRQVR